MGILKSCTPRQDVLAGELRDAIFAADFGDVISGRTDASAVYRDPVLFFQNTHPAVDLTRIVQQVFKTLSNDKQPGLAIRLSTGFGGGKTHTLLTLWHLANNIGNEKLGTELLAAEGRPRRVNVAAVDGAKAGFPVFAKHGGVQVRSLAGEIAYSLGGADAVRSLGDADAVTAQPTEAALEALFPAGPVLLLLDELVIYLSGLDSQGQKNTLNVVNKLVAIAARRPQTVLVVTDPGAQMVYASESADLARQLAAAKSLDEILGRKATDFDPIGSESAKVIARRLFEHVDPNAAQKVAADFHQLYERVADEHPELLPPVVRTTEYTKRIQDSYPFHPRLLDTAKDRLGALPDFQRSRGVLRLFARIIKDVWQRKEDVALISAGEVDFSSATIKGDLLQRLNKDQFEAAVSADIESHAAELDEYRRGVHTRVASALMLESLPANSHAGLTPDDLTLAVLRLDDGGSEPTEALDHLVGTCWHTYPMDGGNGYQFRFEPNVRKQIEERRNKVPLADAEARVHAEVQQYFQGPSFKTANWPADAHAVPDSATLHLVLCSSEVQARSVVENSDDRDPSAPLKRRFINAIVAVAPTDNKYRSAIQRAQTLIAAEDLGREYASGDGGAMVREQLKKLKPDLEKQFRIQARRAFDRVASAGANPTTMDETYQGGDDEILRAPRGQQVLRSFLDAKELIYGAIDSLAPQLLATKVLPGAVEREKEVWTALAVHERLLGAPGMRIVPDEEVTRRSLRAAVEVGTVVVRLADGRAYDRAGAVQGPTGARKRHGRERLTAFALDSETLVALPSAPSALGWLAEDKPQPGGPGTVSPPSPPSAAQASVTTAEISKAIEHAFKRPLERLILRARTPAGAKMLSALAQPFGATRLTLAVSVSGEARGGGTFAFNAEGVKLTHPLKPLDLASGIANALESPESFEASVTLDWDSGLLLASDQLRHLEEQASDVEISAVFGAIAGGGA